MTPNRPVVTERDQVPGKNPSPPGRSSYHDDRKGRAYETEWGSSNPRRRHVESEQKPWVPTKENYPW